MPKPLKLALIVLALGLVVVSAPEAQAQDLTLNLPDSGSLSLRSLQLIALITVLSLAPGLAIMLTCFPFIVTVLSILRQALGLQQSPPNMLIVSLALFLTYFIMDPVFREAWATGLGPLSEGLLPIEVAVPRAMEPFRSFMLGRTDPETVARLVEMRREIGQDVLPDSTPYSVLIPSFLLSEVERAFQIGFLIFLPFLIIDLVVAAILMSMGMMMVPPAVVSLPFKLAFFVVADGWSLISEALLQSYL